MKKKFILQADYQANNTEPDLFGDEEAALEWFFHDVDKGYGVDTIMWEVHPFIEMEVEAENFAAYKGLKARGCDLMNMAIDECHKRGIEAIMHYRISEVDHSHMYGTNNRPVKDDKTLWNPVKLAHPDWVVKTWWVQGHWNVAAEGVREMKLEYIERMLKKYKFDGICVDFSRHTPCYPVGREWELRECGSALMAGVREIGKRLDRPFRVGAKVPKCEQFCISDGFDVREWTKRGLVDFFVIGSRSITVDVAWYKEITKGTEIEIYPCWDCHHSTDAYHCYPADFFRGMLKNWFSLGADGAVGFNFAPTVEPNDFMKKWTEWLVHPYSEFKDYFNEFDNDSLSRRYVAERRGGYPYRTGKFTSNDDCRLPLVLANDGTPAEVKIEAYGKHSGVARVEFTISGAKRGIDEFEIYLNGEKIPLTEVNFDYVDPQVFFPSPQPASSGLRHRYETPNPSKLLLLSGEVDSSRIADGVNTVAVAVIDRTNYFLDDISIEKAEITVFNS